MFIITTPAEDRSLLTESEARVAINNTSADVTALVARVSAAIVGACRVPRAGATPPTLRMETITETFRLKSHQAVLVLSRRPGVTLTSVTENDVVLEAADYEWDAAAGILKRLSSDHETCWPCGKIVVVYSAGWETVPDDLKGIAAELAQTFWADASKGDSNLRSMEIPGVISQTWWVDNTDVAPIPEKLMNALHQGGYVNHWVG